MQQSEWIEFLDAQPAFSGSGEFTLDPVMKLLALCGDPHLRLPPTIHVTGTNGKGSVVAYTSRLLAASGENVASFTSPHAAPAYKDHLTVNCEAVSDSVFGQAAQRVKEALSRYTDPTTTSNEPEYVNHLKSIGVIKIGEKTTQKPSQFELITAICIVAMADIIEPKPGVCVIEVGLGGRVDSTNIIPPSACCAFTSIDTDHVSILGDTPAKIAVEKSGIIKPGTKAVVSYPQSDAVRKVLLDKCSETGCEGFSEVSPPFEAPAALHNFPRHQVLNYMLACEAVRCVRPDLPVSNLSKDVLLNGSLMAGRFEAYQLEEGHYVVFDGAHNPQAVEGLVEQVELFLKRDPEISGIDVVLGILSDKDAGKIARSFARLTTATFHPVDVPSPRTLPAASLFDSLSTCIPTARLAVPSTLPDVLHRLAPSLSNKNPVKTAVLITGSFYLLKAAREALGSSFALNNKIFV
eukprot:TRINITY_DN1693_c3_g1_i1.p1 TRINITY_DN1693_c3_g1~~TRINITY_DN1693_c3_g1_i1.p1  ORF type:complete len:474 (+),score=102.76 TRINITY_DN1693_c3_g1_i1:32-1423(+)